MEKIVSTEDLRTAIKILEAEQEAKGRELKEQFYQAYDKLIPDLKRTFIMNKVVNTTLGVVTGLISRKLVASAPVFLLKSILGPALQFGVTSAVLNNSKTIETLGKIIQGFFTKKKAKNFENSESDLKSTF